MLPPEIRRLRLHNQRIGRGKLAQPARAVTWLGAIQAQEYASSLWAVGLRCDEATQDGVEQALANRSILRTWLLRGTLHLVTPEDLHWMLDLLAPRLIKAGARRDRELELDQAVYTRSFNILTGALEKAGQLTRKELLTTLEQNDISTTGQRGYHILARAALQGLICFGPQQGTRPTFVLLDNWTPTSPSLTKEAALAELARRYFTSRGPATLADFTWWSGLPAQEARAGLDLVKAELQPDIVEDQIYWLKPGGPNQPDGQSAVSLLPGFDEYYLGYADRSLLLDPRFRKQAVSSNGVFRPMIVIDGQVAGIWKRELKKDRLVIKPQLFDRLDEAQQTALMASALPYGEFLGLPVELA